MFLNFLDFILIFQVFFRINFIIKITKRVYYSRGTRGADVAHCGHLAEPREPTWTSTWTREQWVGR